MIACCTYSRRAPGGGSGNGHRTESASGVRLPDQPETYFTLKVSGAGPTDLKSRRLSLFLPAEGAESPLAGHRTASLHCCSSKLRPIPVRRSFPAWDCKVTPADCACQEGNTIGCISNNDGLDAGLGPRFPQKRGLATICWAGQWIPFMGPYLEAITAKG